MTAPDAPSAAPPAAPPGRTTGAPGLVEVGLGRGVRAALTTTGLGNLGTAVGDDPARVAAARARVEAWLGVPLAFGRQVHGADVLVVDAPPGPGGEPLAAVDGLVTARDDVALGVVVADCVPVLLADDVAGVVGVAHAGRRGVVAGVVPAVLRGMTAAGAVPASVRAVVGPAACGRCYEVPADLQDEVAGAVPDARSTTSWGSPALDLPRAVVGQLRAAGVRQVEHVGGCTLEDERWYSHRAATGGSVPAGVAGRAAAVGRMAGVIRLLPRAGRTGGVSSEDDGGARLA